MKTRRACPDCGGPTSGKRCLPCNGKHQQSKRTTPYVAPAPYCPRCHSTNIKHLEPGIFGGTYSRCRSCNATWNAS